MLPFRVDDLYDTRAKLDLSNVDPNIDYVIESWSDGAADWYRKYRSGWCEQGGEAPPIANNGYTASHVNLHVPFINVYYFVTIHRFSIQGNSVTMGCLGANELSKTGFNFWNNSGMVNWSRWKAEGYYR
jgi:hypothetical protein